MSNELAVVLQQASLVTKGLDDDTKAVAGGMQNYRISLAGGTFRMIVNGKEQASIEDRSMNVIFVKMSHNPSRTYYEGAYKEGQKSSPVCWSSDSKTPDPEVKNPVAPNCGGCPNAIKGSGQGGTGTACRMSWRTAVVLPQQLDGPIYQLVLPATSSFGEEENGRWPFRPYIQMLASHNVSAGAVVTKMQFDTKAKVPRVLFSPAGAVNTDDLDSVRKQAQAPAAVNAVKMTVYQSDKSEEDEEPTKRESDKRAQVQATSDGTPSDLVKKWAKKSA